MRLKTTFFGGFSRFQKLNFSIKRSYLSISMMSNSKKVTDWTEFEINDKKWLPLDVKLDSVANVIKNLDLRHVNISDSKDLFDQIDDEKIIGFVCASPSSIEFSSRIDHPKKWAFIPVRTENSTLTIQILNLCALNGKFRDVIYGYLLEKYLRDSSSSKENFSLMNSVYSLTPIAFAHNVAAKDFPLNNSQQKVYVFAKLDTSIVMIGDDGRLYSTEQSNFTATEFVEYMKNKLCEVYTIVEDPFKEIYNNLEEKKTKLANLMENKSNFYLDESFSYDDLKELSTLNEQIEEAESFELIMDVKSTKHNEKVEERAETSTSKTDISIQENQIRELEHEIRDLVKKIEELQKIFPHIYWPQISDSDLYGSREYLKFYSHYKKVVHVATPKLMKSYEIAPIRTPKSGKRSKRAGSTASSLTDVSISITTTATPKRRRSSRTN